MSPLAASGAVFLGLIAYALIAYGVVRFLNYGDGFDWVMGVFWPILATVVALWYLLFRPWRWAFRAVGDFAETLGIRYDDAKRAGGAS